MLLIIIGATLLVSLISLIGILILFKKNNKQNFLKNIISLAAGALLAVAFLDLLPGVIEEEVVEPHLIFAVVLGSILFFFILEKIFHWHHCQCEYHGKPHNQKKHLVYINLIGDGIHNFVDGALIAAAFMLDFNAGVLVTLAVILHEIPQEISDFGVLLYAGLSKMKAILYNLLIAVTAIIGAVTFYYFGNNLEIVIPLVIAFAVGNFIYLATADLMPELHHEKNPKKIFAHTIWLIVGIILIYFAGQFIPHTH